MLCRKCLIVAMLIVLIACERREDIPTLADVRAEDDPVQESWGVHLYISYVPLGSEETNTRLEMIADYMARYETPDSSYQELTGQGEGNRVRIHIYDLQGDSSATVTADQVLYHDRESRFEARGNVIVETRDAKRLETETLKWTEVERKIHTQSFVHITTEDESVQGYGLVADEDLVSYEIGRFTARVALGDGDEE